MKRKSKQKEEELNYWQPASDMFSALMLVLMLVILLLCLYLVRIPDNDQIDPWYGDDGGGGGYPTPTMVILYADDGGGGGDDDGGYSPVPTYEVTPTPDSQSVPASTISCRCRSCRPLLAST